MNYWNKGHYMYARGSLNNKKLTSGEFFIVQALAATLFIGVSVSLSPANVEGVQMIRDVQNS